MKEVPDEIERFCPCLKISQEFVTQRTAIKSLKNIPSSVIGSDDEYYGDGWSGTNGSDSDESDSDSYSYSDDDIKAENVRYTGNLDKWDKAARSWLSSGTIFFLMVLFHILQVRSDLRKFTTAANNQLQQACTVLEDKSISLQTALGLAASDVGPITIKFVRDLKSKVRGAFLIAAQIFGSKVRAVLISIGKQYYCYLVAILVAIVSFKHLILDLIAKFFDKGTFIEKLCTTLVFVVEKIIQFVTQPEAFFNDMISSILDEIFEGLMAVDIPIVNCEKMKHLCGKKSSFNFEGIHNLLRSYLTKMVALTAVLLIIFNAVTFIRTIRLHEYELKKSKKDQESDELLLESDESDTETIGINMSTVITRSPSSTSSFSTRTDSTSSSNNSSSSCSSYDLYDEKVESDGCFINAARWIFNFFSYEPFLLFICMGIFGICHAYFSNYLREQAREIKRTIIDPEIDNMKDLFTEVMQDYVKDLEFAWRNTFSTLLKPLDKFIANLVDNFGDIMDIAIGIGKTILRLIDDVMDQIKKIVLGEAIANGIVALMDCMFLKSFKFWLKIADMIRTHLFSNKWKELSGGIAVLLKSSITAIFEKLQITKVLKKMFSISFAMFMRMVAKRSIFLYVYLIVCALLISQGIFMITVKFVLGYF